MRKLVTTLVVGATLFVALVAVLWLNHPGQTLFAAQRGGTLAPFPAPFRLVNQGGYLGGVNDAGPTYTGGLGRQIRVGTATYANATTGTVVAVSGATTAAGTASTIEVFTFDTASGTALHAQTLTVPNSDPSFTPLALGYINGDGVPDLIVASISAQIAYVYLSQSGTLSYGAPIALTPPSVTAYFGQGLTAADVDPQSLRDEIIVGAPGGGSGKTAVIGKVFVYRFNGSTFDTGTPLDTSNLALKTDDLFGWRVAAGDVTGDGSADIIVSAPKRDVNGATDSGAAYVFAGPVFTTSSSLATSIKNDTLGNVIAGNPNGDSWGDVVATAHTSPRAIVFTGQILSNRTTVVAPDYALLPADTAWTGGWGTGVGIGDLNGDGISDVLVGAPNAGPASCSNTGAAHIYLSDFWNPTSPAAYLLQPPALDADWNAYAWGVTAVAATTGHPGYLLVGEPGRNLSGVTNAGQMYVYRVCSLAFPCQ